MNTSLKLHLRAISFLAGTLGLFLAAGALVCWAPLMFVLGALVALYDAIYGMLKDAPIREDDWDGP